MQMYINNAAITADLDDSLARAVVISLFSWHRAEEGDTYDCVQKFGWWGDTYNDYQTGSKLWQYLRSSLTTNNIVEIRECCEEALHWLIDDNIASSVIVTPERNGNSRLDLTINITLKDLSNVTYKFEEV